MYMLQVNKQLALHLACARAGAGNIQIVQQILRWSSKDIRLTADRVSTVSRTTSISSPFHTHMLAICLSVCHKLV